MHSQCDYIVSAMRINNVQSKVKGFALIAAISVLLLLTLVAVAFLSLSAVTLRTSRFEWAQEEARANARLGLMIAIGEIQRDLGPDQRIAVSASILDDDPDTAQIDGVANHHWTGVMSSVFDQNSNGSPYTRDMDNGGLQDARGGTAYRAEDFIVNYIVSGNEGGRDNIAAGRQYLDAQTETLQVGEDAVRIVSRGSASDPNDYVVVKTMTTEKLQQLPDGSEGLSPKGRYAFWVSSNNQKANVGRSDVHGNLSVDESGQGVQRLLHPLDTEPFVLEGVDQGQDVRDNRVLTPKSLTLVSSDNRDGVLLNYHAITGLSSSVLCNVRDGGLKKNFSAFLHGQDGTSAPTVNDLDGSVPYYIGISPQDRLVGPPNESFAQLRGEDFTNSQYQDIAPTYELLWNWAQLANEFSFGSGQTGIRPQKIWNGAPFNNGGLNIYDGQNQNPSDPRNLTDVKLTPVISEACVYYNLATYPVGTGSTQEHALRLCLYPRVGLWNPYNVDMELDRDMILQLFLNGKKMVHFDGSSNFSREIYYGGRSNNLDTGLGGQVYFTLPSVTIPAGETFIFSMGGAPQELDINNIGNNVLQAQDAPSSASYLFKDYLNPNLTSNASIRHNRDDDNENSELMPRPPTTFREVPEDNGRHGSDNYLFILKYLDGNNNASNVTRTTFAELPTLVYASISLQAGGSDEFANEWATNVQAPVVNLTGAGDRVDPGIDPHPFTRDGFRIRWLDETASNLGANGQNELFLQEAPLGNWNLRASYVCRNPYDSVTSTQPYFHGIYTRDNPSDEVSWGALTPRLNEGFQTGFPFGPAGFGVDTVIAYEVPTREVGIPSLAYLRHLQLSEYVWHPSYAIGSSLADPKVEITGTTPTDDLGGNHGWDNGGNGYGTRYWNRLFSDLVFYLAEENHLVFDMSYEVNHNLWSDYFLTGATASQITNFAQDPVQNPLKNGNLRLWDTSGDPNDDLNDFFRAAGRLMMDGGFDVHSVNVEAWKALLATTRDTGYGSQNRTPFPRTLFPKNDENIRSEYSTATFTGYRSLGDQEIAALANEIVRQVKLRAPFFGMSDFVNRRLADDETGTSGTIEAALQSELSGITAAPNRGQNDEFPIAKQQQQDQGQLIARPSQGETSVVMGSRTRTNQELKPASRGYGTPGYITQGDVLQVIGSGLVARSDTFTVRAYGESVDVNGTVLAKAWCEATVQRTPEPIDPDDITGMNPRIPQDSEIDFGRRFEIISFRWLNADEV